MSFAPLTTAFISEMDFRMMFIVCGQLRVVPKRYSEYFPELTGKFMDLYGQLTQKELMELPLGRSTAGAPTKPEKVRLPFISSSPAAFDRFLDYLATAVENDEPWDLTQFEKIQFDSNQESWSFNPGFHWPQPAPKEGHFRLIASDGQMDVSREMALKTMTVEQLDSYVKSVAGIWTWHVNQPLDRVRPVDFLEEFFQKSTITEDNEGMMDEMKKLFPSGTSFGPVQKYFLGFPLADFSKDEMEMFMIMYDRLMKYPTPSAGDEEPHICPEWLQVHQVLVLPEDDYQEGMFYGTEVGDKAKEIRPVLATEATPKETDQMIPVSWKIRVANRTLILTNQGTFRCPEFSILEGRKFSQDCNWLYLPPKDLPQMIAFWEKNQKTGEEEFFKVPEDEEEDAEDEETSTRTSEFYEASETAEEADHRQTSTAGAGATAVEV